MICFPNAKINIGLNIVSKRDDGYHNLETIFYPIPIKDALEIIVNEDLAQDTFIQTGNAQIDLPSEDNLVMKALKLMRTRYQIPFIEVHLLKTIPSGAGIGGGSADAAFMLHLLNDTFSLNASDTELATLALQLGADCPFFIYNTPMYAEGIGEKLSAIDLSLKEYYLILIKPDIHISTKEAFANIVPQQPQLSIEELIGRPIEEWKDSMLNDFEKSIALQYPRIETLKTLLYQQGAVYASMSGSGSSVYGIFDCPPDKLEGVWEHEYIWEGKME